MRPYDARKALGRHWRYAFNPAANGKHYPAPAEVVDVRGER